MKPYARGLFSPELTSGFRLVSEWFSAVSGGTVCFAIFPFYRLRKHELGRLLFLLRGLFFRQNSAV